MSCGVRRCVLGLRNISRYALLIDLYSVVCCTGKQQDMLENGGRNERLAQLAGRASGRSLADIDI
jgi:hypothetical protein